jgi:hypothetical protein
LSISQRRGDLVWVGVCGGEAGEVEQDDRGGGFGIEVADVAFDEEGLGGAGKG